MPVPGTYLQGWRWLRGRADRGEYWLWVVVIFAWGYLFAWADDQAPLQVLVWAFWLQAIRRLHDVERSGWWIGGFVLAEVVLAAVATSFPGQAWAASLAIAVELISLILLGVWPGSRDENRFGPPPRRARRRVSTLDAA